MQRSDETINPEVLNFLNSYIDSVEQLRVLIFLHSSAERSWTVSEISTEMRSVESSISKRLKDLYRLQVLIKDENAPDAHRYAPATAEMSRVIDILVDENRTKPYTVIEVIYAKPAKAIQEFANAFKIRGDQS